MTPRSWLFIPGDSEKKLAKADASGADALILDLEDAVAPPAKPAARIRVHDFLAARPGPRPVAVMGADQPLGQRPGARRSRRRRARPAGWDHGAQGGTGPADVERLSHYLDVLEAQHGFEPGAIRILPVATETAAAPFRLGDYAEAGLGRLAGLTWGAEDLATALGASTNLDETGRWALTFRLVRSLTLLGARAAGVQPIDTLYVDFRDEEGPAGVVRGGPSGGFHRSHRHTSRPGRGDQRGVPAVGGGDRLCDTGGRRLRGEPVHRNGEPGRPHARYPAPETGPPGPCRDRSALRPAMGLASVLDAIAPPATASPSPDFLGADSLRKHRRQIPQRGRSGAVDLNGQGRPGVGQGEGPQAGHRVPSAPGWPGRRRRRRWCPPPRQAAQGL